MKVKIIRFDNAETFQNEINNFVKEKKIVDIKYNTTICPLKYNGYAIVESTFFDSALILYEEE